ncbi:glycosyltransferase [Cedecea colo]|uniref:Glycosyltransferase n=1 Tax=Cedecea colo TaxID=2552946 RepID=A0ABX0VJ92_9ENTR|nr:glycosyltransferase [Cedecea colo]NIY46207.1 glycosyltransferase [Cedecea colo]
MHKKIAYIITKSEVGGAQKWIKEQRELLSVNYDIYLITSEPGWLAEQFPADHVFYVKEILSLSSISASYKIAKILKSIKATVVINNSANAGLHGRLAKLFFHHRSIYVSHGWSCIYNGGRFSYMLCLIERILSFFSDKILCVSKTDYDKAINHIGISSKKLLAITTGIKPVRLRPDNNNLSGPIKLVFVGRMAHPKRPDLLLKVISKLPNVNIDLIGDGPLLFSLKEKYISQKNIHFLGEIRDFDSFYKYDALVLTSDSEGLPMSALEAASAGLPLLLSNVGGCWELINDANPNGILYKNDFQSFHDSVVNLIKNYSAFQKSASNLKNDFSLHHKYNEYVYLIEGE